jgi:methylase of polypeptide subunit release factors
VHLPHARPLGDGLLSDKKSVDKPSEASLAQLAQDAVAELKSTCQTAAHTGRLMAFSEFLRKVFQVEISRVAPKVEQYRSLEISTLRGRPDLPFGDVIVEMKRDIQKERETALDELRTYGPLLSSKPTDPIPVGLVTDGLRYEVYTYELANGRPKTDSDGRFVVSRPPIDSFDIEKLSPVDFCLRLDALLFRQRPLPTSGDLALRFGTGSPTYHIIMGGLEAAYNTSRVSIATRFQQWEKNMGVVYGSSPGVKAFLGHTYLVLLSRLLIDMRINGEIRSDDDLIRSIRGDRLAQYGLGGYEGGYFTWVLDPAAQKTALPLLRKLTDQLSLYDVQKVSGDLFRAIYQEIVTTEVRHRTGEYYTPQWLTELMVNKVLEKYERPSIIDPACGSGTFLAASIEALKKRGLHLQEILRQVVGIDINPMAVEIARATYLLALGKLLNERVSEIDLPVYVADSLRLPKPDKFIEAEIPVFKIQVSGETIALPESIAQNEDVLLAILRMFLSVLESYEAGKVTKKDAINTMAVKVLSVFQKRSAIKEEWKVLEQTLFTLMNLIDKRNNSIWVFLLRNLYAPARLSRSKFDVVIGNPPWISLRYIIDDNYQEFIKEQMKARNLMDQTRPQLVTQTEIATLFFVEASRLYLNDKGMVAFVMPRSVITGAQQHTAFQKLRTPAFVEILDFGGVAPIFNVPSCVIFALKRGKTKYPVKMTAFEGELSGRDLAYSEAIAAISSSEKTWTPVRQPSATAEESAYRNLFKQGATIVPRSFWFVDFVPHPEMGINPSSPLVRTSSEAAERAKKPWGSITLEGRVESKYIFTTLLAKDLSSFAMSTLKPIILPLTTGKDGGFALLDTEELGNLGDSLMHDWLEKCEKHWRENATRKSGESFPSVLKRVDYQHELTGQTNARYAVLYPASGTHVAACMIDTQELPPFLVSGQSIHPTGFVADAKTYIYRTDSKQEALYLVGILNSTIVNQTIKETQSRGIFGPRDIHKRPLNIPFPRFNPKDKAHARLVELTQSAIAEAKKAISNGQKGRKKFIDSLEGIEELDTLVKQIIES